MHALPLNFAVRTYWSLLTAVFFLSLSSFISSVTFSPGRVVLEFWSFCTANWVLRIWVDWLNAYVICCFDLKVDSSHIGFIFTGLCNLDERCEGQMVQILIHICTCCWQDRQKHRKHFKWKQNDQKEEKQKGQYRNKKLRHNTLWKVPECKQKSRTLFLIFFVKPDRYADRYTDRLSCWSSSGT